ncbi:hypothetical protein IEO21_01879 [Rhodonia placenta]|uniref:WDR36/Utp21 C-terminal domain-containing protein n=1 Tax=Rhodonia placenta TaxID=104341 RepID=A0A8H7U4Y1_9APHY|nr:hypothetical protein IEO21_01879 [Postia placenta]
MAVAVQPISAVDHSEPPPRKRLRTEVAWSPKVQPEPRLFAPFRALGLVTNHVPFALQTRSHKGATEGPRTHIVTCLGKSWAMWEGGKMGLLFVGPDAPEQITSMVIDGKDVWVSSGSHVIKYIRGKEVRRLANPLGTPIASMLVFGSQLLSLTQDGTRMFIWDLEDGGRLIDAFRTSSVATSVAFSPTNDFLATAHVDSVGVYLWANRAQYSEVALQSVPDDEKVIDVALPSMQGTAEDEALDALSSLALTGQEKSSDFFLAPPEFDGDLVTLSLMPRSRWQTLLNFEVIQQRNKPKEPPKEPEKAPFFLPTLPGVEPRFAIEQNESEKTKKQTKRLQKASASSDSTFYKMLAAEDPHGDYEEFFTYAKSLSPAAIDLELRSLVTLDALRTFLTALNRRLRSHRDFEAVQSFQNVFLRMHGDVLTANPELQEELEMLQDAQRKESENVELRQGYVVMYYCILLPPFAYILLKEAKESHPDQVPTSSVPNELWLDIFKHATFVPGALDCDDGHAIACFTRDKDGICLANRHREAMDIALALCLVCKRWNMLATEFVFAYIRVKDGEQAIRLADALRHYATTYPYAPQPGRHVIRLELALEGAHAWTRLHSWALIKILKSCPRLSVFSTAFCSPDVYLWEMSTFPDAICHGLKGSKLRRFESGYIPSFVRKLAPTLEDSLEVLWLRPSDRRLTKKRVQTSSLAFPRLHMLILSEAAENCFAEVAMPSLQTCILEDPIQDSDKAPQCLLARYGEQLRYLVTSNTLQVSYVLENCPRIAHWTIPCAAVGMLRVSEAYSSIISLTLIEESSLRTCMLPMALRSLHSILSEDKSFVSLRLIRFQLPLRSSFTSFVRTYNEHWEYSCIRHGGLLLHLCDRRKISVQASFGVAQQSADCWAPFTEQVLPAATTGVLAGAYGLVKGSTQIGPLITSAALNGGVAGATFFSFREYIASPVLLHALANTEYSRRIRELQASRRAGGRSGEKLTWWDMRMNKVPDTAISGAFTGAILNAWKRGPAGIVPGVTTAGLACTLIQLAYNELDIARIKYVSRTLQETRKQQDAEAALPMSQPVPLPSPPIEPRKSFIERMLVTMGFHQVTDEEFLEKLKFKRDYALRRIEELEQERAQEKEKIASETVDSQTSVKSQD